LHLVVLHVIIVNHLPTATTISLVLK
jgi:hypothetical protein